jgi:hypothetical protein
MTTTGGQIKLEEGTGHGTTVGFKAPNTEIVEDVIWTLPDVDGEPGQVLATDGFGNLEWATVPLFLSYDANTAYTGYLIYPSILYSLMVNIGDRISVNSSNIVGFIGWNTKADGTGVWYYPYNIITIPSHSVKLYAQKSSSNYY